MASGMVMILEGIDDEDEMLQMLAQTPTPPQLPIRQESGGFVWLVLGALGGAVVGFLGARAWRAGGCPTPAAVALVRRELERPPRKLKSRRKKRIA